MQKRFFLLLSFVASIFGLQLFSQHNAQAKSGKPTLEKSLLWRISGKGLTLPTYVFGTMHAICSDDYFFTEKMESAFSETTNLVLEVDLTNPDMNNMFQENMVLPQGQTLADYFSDEQMFKTFSTRLNQRMDIDIEQFKNFKPKLIFDFKTFFKFSVIV